jgi:hypothetical protein
VDIGLHNTGSAKSIRGYAGGGNPQRVAPPTVLDGNVAFFDAITVEKKNGAIPCFWLSPPGSSEASLSRPAVSPLARDKGSVDRGGVVRGDLRAEGCATGLRTGWLPHD